MINVLVSIFFLALLAGTPGESCAQSATIFKLGEDILINKGTKAGTIIAIGGQSTVSGTVEGNVIALGNSVVLTKTAVVSGNVVSLGGVVVLGRGAEVDGTVTEINSSNLSDVITTILSDEWEGWSWVQAIFSLALFLCTLIIACSCAYFFPAHRNVAAAVRHYTWKSTWWGIFGLILVMPLAVLLTVSVVGIVLIPLEIILVVCAGFMGFIAVAQLVGAGLLRLFKRKETALVRETFLGLSGIWLIGWLPVVGWMLKVFALTIGLGAVIFTRFGTAPSSEPAES
jgi:hypothetical protein